ncbi:fatty acid--CoA ligase [Microvirga mediterraneensis]|uniref:Fatty acid--CoA ligase n=1 Tax=Microvirga mediterraneensis TaxID=2754695 RepID=A0A838BKE8_9HYPH|nr:fatty acid--CoA ligase [Microvirga mediterraneensis]MBA1156017.1 fatty acid--CoA ligase [Microvirga mediterraneensis]
MPKSGDIPACEGTGEARCTAPTKLIEHAPSAYSYPLLIKHLLHTPLRHAPDQEIVYRDRVRYDYRTFDRRIRRLAGALAGRGVRPGDTVGVLDWDSHRYLECYFAVPSMGAVLHMVNIRLSPEQVLYTINHAQDDVLLVHADFLPLIESIRDRIERVRTIVVMVDDYEVPATSLEVGGEYEALLAAAPEDYDFPDFDENTRATTFYTTGTTGLPKGVYFSHRQLVLHTLAGAAAFGASAEQGRLHRGDVYMPITPMFHVHAWGFPFIATMLGVKQVYPGRYAPETLLTLIETEKVTFSHCVPTLLHMLLTSPAGANTDLRAWKVVVGGSALPKGLARAAYDRGIDVFTGYGMSETCPLLTVAQLTPAMLDEPADQQVENRTQTGLPIPLVDLRVVDAEMNDVPRDGKSTGEVVVRSPWLTQGYFGDPAQSEALWQGGYLHTNDVGFIHPSGSLQITDRLKDVIKTGGEWISSLEIEDILSQHPGVGEVAVIGVPDDKWGERPLAIVVPKAGHEGSLTQGLLEAHLAAYADKGLISKWAVPDRIVFTTAIMRTSVGKTNKKALREFYAQQAGEGSGA